VGILTNDPEVIKKANVDDDELIHKNIHEACH